MANTLNDTVADVIRGSKLPAKRRGPNIKPDVDHLTSELYDRGALPEVLRDLIDLITTPSFLDQASLGRIVRNLYPATPVPVEDVIKVVGCLGHGVQKPSMAIQANLLKWLVMVHHIIEKQNALSNAYPVLFNLLDTAAIRPQLCHLLALITRRKHVRPYRIQALLALSRQTGGDPHVTGLLRVFKDYYPEIIAGEATRGKAPAFKHPDKEWRERLDEIQRAHAQSQSETTRRKDGFRVHRSYTSGHSKGIAVPEVHTSHAQENSVTLEEIDNVSGLVDNFEKIELPNQMVAVLADPLLQKLMLLKPAAESQQRVSNWINSAAQDLRDQVGYDTDGFFQLLEGYVTATKSLPLPVMALLSSYLKVWNGRESRELVMSILSYAPLPASGFAELYASTFQPLEGKVLDGSANSQQDLLICYLSLLRHWVISSISEANEEEQSEEPLTAVSDLVNHANRLCLSLLQSDAGVASQSMVLEFYEEVSKLASQEGIAGRVRIVVPPAALVYMLYFSPSPNTASRVCGVLIDYKESFQSARARSGPAYSPGYINSFNGFLMDTCNGLWRAKAFNSRDPNAHGCLMAEDMVADLEAYLKSLDMQMSLGSLFTLSASPTFGSLAAEVLRELEAVDHEHLEGGLNVRHGGPPTKISLAALGKNGGLSLTWDEYRLDVLGDLERRDMAGVSRLLHNTIAALMNRT